MGLMLTLSYETCVFCERRSSTEARGLAYADPSRPQPAREEESGGAECDGSGLPYTPSQGAGHLCTQPEVHTQTHTFLRNRVRAFGKWLVKLLP